MKYTLSLKQNLPFANCPALVELDDIKIICNDVMLPNRIEPGYNPNGIKLYVIGHEHGPICAIFAGNDRDALDSAVDANMLECLLCDNQTEIDPDDNDFVMLGNASEYHDLTHAWLAEVDFDAAHDIKLICALIRASEQGKDTL